MKGKKIDYKALNFIMLSGFIMLALLFVDQITKAVAQALNVHQNTYFLGIICFNFTFNPGMAFSWFADNETIMIVITVLTVFMIVAIAVLYFTLFKHNKPAQICLMIIEAGAIGNLIDRLYFGAVRDFIDVSPLHFGICNPADFFITFGAVALVFIILFIGKSAVFPLTKKWREEARKEHEKDPGNKRKKSHE